MQSCFVQIQIVESNVSSIGPSSLCFMLFFLSFVSFVVFFSLTKGQYARNVGLYYPYWPYTDLFIFRYTLIEDRFLMIQIFLTLIII